MDTMHRVPGLGGTQFRRRLLVLTWVGAALLGSACGQARSTATQGGHHRRSAAASETPADLVRSIESGFSQSKIVTVTLGDTPAEYKGQESGPWMYVQLSSVTGPASVMGKWEANLLAAAYAAQAPSVGLSSESGMFVMNSATCLANRDSSSCDESGGPIADIAEGATKPVPFDPTSASPSSLQTTIQSGLKNAGLQLESISMDTVDDHPVPVVIARSDNPSAVFADPPTDASIFGAEPNNFEGIYFELDDSQGNPVVVQSFASRTGAGAGWTSPAYSSESG